MILRYSTLTKKGFLRQDEILYPVIKNSESKGEGIPHVEKDFYLRLAKAAEERTKFSIVYQSAYVKIDYPNGDVPDGTGVCTDVIIRSYRKIGIDLQVKVHEDMKNNFLKYPRIWRLTKPDTNIDHRRVPNLMTFFRRHGVVLEKSNNGYDYKPGDIVTWDLGGGVTHIGIVSP